MKTRNIIFMLIIGFISINANAIPHDSFIKKAPAFLILAITQCPSVISKSIENISNVNTNALEQLLQQNKDIESKLDKVTAISITSLVLTVLSILVICKLPCFPDYN